MFLEWLQYAFIQRAIIAGSFVSLSCAILGVILVLKKHSMIGDGLAHVSFATVAFSLILGLPPLSLSLPFVIISSFFILMISKRINLYGDAAIGMISSFSVALGVLIASIGDGFNVDLFSYLFGSILVIDKLDLYLSVILSIIVIIMIIVYYEELFAMTYDEAYAKINGVKVELFNYMLAVMTSVTIVLGIRVVGTMLVSSLIVFPAVSALQISKSFKNAIILSGTISVVCLIAGVFVSYELNLPTGATVVCLNAICFVISFLYRKFKF